MSPVPNPATDLVEHWQRQLRDRVGLGGEECARLAAGLEEYCAARQVSPATLLATWTDFPDLLVRRSPGSLGAPNTAVESFLIHNGVNVFGDIVCVASRPEDLAEQGPWFTGRGR